MISRNKGKLPTATSRTSFSAGMLFRGGIERELHDFLSRYIDVEYEIKLLHKGWLSSSYCLDIEYYGNDIKFFKGVSGSILEYFRRLSSDESA